MSRLLPCLFIIVFIHAKSDAKPEQVVLSFSGDATSMAVTWISLKPCEPFSVPNLIQPFSKRGSISFCELWF